MKRLLTDYVFDASAKTVTLPSIDTVEKERLLIITNVTDGVIIYLFNDPLLGGTVSGKTITLTYNTANMSDTDTLQIFYEDEEDLLLLLKTLLQLIAFPQYLDQSANQIRAQVTGTISTVSTVTACTGLTNIDLHPGRMLVFDNELTAWSVGCRSLIG